AFQPGPGGPVVGPHAAVLVVVGELLQNAEEAAADIDLEMVVRGTAPPRTAVAADVVLGGAEVADVAEQGGVRPERRPSLLRPLGDVQPREALQQLQDHLLAVVPRPVGLARAPDLAVDPGAGQAEEG